MDPLQCEWVVEGNRVKLTPKEYACLEALLVQEGPYISKQQLMNHIWPVRMADPPSSEELNTVLYRLRKKVDPWLRIRNIRGRGYNAEVS
ncbi:helix-turn-helix domain-containing protein [Halobacillus litoralis]|uniref:helix-turn-helix domain-containing protein n=1 Tax=Halobacillus litoralis TaxID=45668 RepID=UPI001CD54F1D|nr:helix-turn-helix domain-containing protein [Halobacillus litoralis]MCA0972110.1 helix-turn-helix domain-containing protein [Halobacillus litoralis]